MMSAKLTLDYILDNAIQKEVESRLLYIGLAQRVNKQIAKDTFIHLAKQEQEHQNTLEQYKRGELKSGKLSSEQVIDYKISEFLDQPEVTPDMKLKDIFLLGSDKEKASHEFYLFLAKIHPPGEIKKLLVELAAQELEHKHKLEFLYVETAFPQTDGG